MLTYFWLYCDPVDEINTVTIQVILYFGLTVIQSRKNFISLLSHWFRVSESLLERLQILIALFSGITRCNWQHAFSQALDKGSLLKQKCIFAMCSTFGLSCKIISLKKHNLEPAPTNLMTVIRTDSLVARESQDRSSNDLQHEVIVLC